jgi:predicted aminopeptidase
MVVSGMSSTPRPRSKVLALVGAAALAALCLSSCYVTAQGFRYLSIRSRAQALDKALADPATSADERLLLERAKEARAFALSELNLRETKNYTSVVRLDADRLATVVQACAELSFDRHLWSYPVVGKLPYRGYFDPKDAQKEAARLKKEGFDVIARPVDAFSTLGWFADPLFSFMSSYGESDIADLVIHEMTHATVFLKGSGGGAEQFNEELATFVGREGAILFLSKKYGPDSAEVKASRSKRRDAEAFSFYLAGTAKELETVYSSSASAQEKRERKAEVIAARAAQFRREYASLFEGADNKDFPMDRINNAYIDLYRLYEGETPLYRDYYEKVAGGDMKAFIGAVSRIAKEKGDPKAAMRAQLAAKLGPAAQGAAQ